jgi:hypothetical protein
MAVDQKISKLVRNQFPDFYKEEGENFLAFMEAYYEYLEQNGKMSDAIRNLQSYSDIATTTDDFIQYFIKTFLPSVPLDVAADKKIMIKYINEFNRARGTFASYKLLFRALYNEDIEVNYPSEQILKVSDGDWRKERYLVTPYDNTTYDFIGKTIVGVESGAQALVEDIVRKNIRGRDIMQILISNIRGAFNNLEPIKLLTDVNGTGHTTIIEAGINQVTIVTPGAQYREGDVVDLISSVKGDGGKVVVTSVENLGGVITFSLTDGGSGYTTDSEGTVVSIIGGDGLEDASFRVLNDDIVDTFALAINTNLLASNTVFGDGAPTVSFANGDPCTMTTFANVMLGAADFGFPEDAESVGNRPYRDHANAILRIANTQDIKVGDSLFGVTSSANGTVLEIVDNTASNTVVRLDGYKNWSTTSGGESIRSIYSNTSGNTVGTVISFSGNTVGYHVLAFGNVAGQVVTEGNEVVGRTSGAFGVVKKVISTVANGYSRGVGGADDRDLVTVQVTANTTANLTSQFDTGPMKSFLENEGLRIVGANTTVGNVVSTTSNTSIENIYTKLSDAFKFETSTFGTIAKLSLVDGGSGYSVAPTVSVRDNNISTLGIGEQYITLQSDDENWGSGNSSFTKLDTNDRLVQTSTGASGDVKGGAAPSTPIDVVQYANGTYEMTVRVWQDFLQRSPNNITFANNATVTLNIYDSSYVPGTVDDRSIADTATAKIVSIVDEGVLGENANVNATVGANGTITGLRVLDSGFCYRDNEIVIIETPNRVNGQSGSVRVDLFDVANSEGYYATSRSHLDSLRGYIQDSNFYQEFSYEVISPIALDRYRDYALELVHPAGQKLFGKFRSQSNAIIDVVANTNNTTSGKVDGTISINNGSFDVSGSGTNFTSVFANGDLMTIEYADKQFYKIPINIVSDNTTANLTIAWSNTSISGANAYYQTGTIV